MIQPSLERRRIPVAHNIAWNLKRVIGHGCEAAGRSARRCIASVTNELVSRFVEGVVTTVGIGKQPYRFSDHVFELLSAGYKAPYITRYRRSEIGGFTDNTGPAAANKKLSTERAEAIKAMLVSLDVAASRLAAAGYGPAQPVCAANDTEECKAKNRRIAVRVTAK